MACETFVEKKFRAESLAKIYTAQVIVAKYQNEGLKLTLRQLYYQFVAHHGLPNTEQSYKNLASLISDARLAGMIDWSAIEDRGRVPETPAEFSGMPDLMSTALRAYRLPRWKGQNCYVELWVEKQALAGVLEPLASHFHVTLMVNKGYSSQSAMYESAQRFLDKQSDLGAEECKLFYLGDHDPSGEDMVRDISERLYLFGADVAVEKLALTMDQIKEYNPPPNPAKRTDARFEKYSAIHGNESWEVDALDPETLSDIVRRAFHRVVDQQMMLAIVEKEKLDKKKLTDMVLAANWDDAPAKKKTKKKR